MASFEPTAYPRFRRVVSARELADLTPTADDVAWARRRSRTDEHLLALVLSLRCFGRLGYFPRGEDVPGAVVDHVRRCLELQDDTGPVCGTPTAKLHLTLVRERLGVICDPQRAREVAEDAIRAAALVKNHPPDLINVALEMSSRPRWSCPGTRRLTSSRRGSVTTSTPRCSSVSVLVLRCPTASRWRACSMSPGRAPRARFTASSRRQAARRGRRFASRSRTCAGSTPSATRTRGWRGIAEAKVADFAGEAMAADAGVMRDVAPAKRTALLACMVHASRTRARDDLAEMFCKRMASITKLAKGELDEIRERQAEMSERLISTYHGVLACLDPRGDTDVSQALRLARATVEQAGGFDTQLADIEAVAAHHANNYMPLVARHSRRDRATMFAFARVVELEATSADRSVLDAVEHALAHAHLIETTSPIMSMARSSTCRSLRSSGSGSSATADIRGA